MSDTELLPKSKAEPVRRLEVFTGAGRRRAWSLEQKDRIVAESYESGETVSAVARRHALTPQQLFGWRRAVRQRRDDEAGAKGSAFTAVMVEAADSDEVARAFRDDVARCSDMMPPGVRCLAG